MRRRNRLERYLPWLALLVVAGMGCAPPPAATPSQPTAPVSAEAGPTATLPSPTAQVRPTATTVAGDVRVLRVMPVTTVVRNDEYYFDNCSGDYPVTRSLAEAGQVQMALTIADSAAPLAGGATIAIPPETKAKLAAAVEAAYSATLDEARTLVQETTLFANAKDRNTVVIVWEERVYSGTASFPINGVAHTTEYTYILEVPRAGTVKPGICTP